MAYGHPLTNAEKEFILMAFMGWHTMNANRVGRYSYLKDPNRVSALDSNSAGAVMYKITEGYGFPCARPGDVMLWCEFDPRGAQEDTLASRYIMQMAELEFEVVHHRPDNPTDEIGTIVLSPLAYLAAKSVIARKLGRSMTGDVCTSATE